MCVLYQSPMPVLCLTWTHIDIHLSQPQHAIMMPAMSPLLSEGTITQWKKKEGEAFSVGDVLLQIVCVYKHPTRITA